MKALAALVLLFAAGAALGAVSSPIPRGTLDPAAPVKPMDEALRSLEADRHAAPVLERYEAGDYDAAARMGEELLARGFASPALRFAVANSLAWTARYDEAAVRYRELFDTAFDVQARVGLANVLRWRGQVHLAEPYYREALAREPANAAAAEGIALAGRELRPAILVRAGRTEDNDLRRDEAAVSYRRWTAERRWRLEAGVLYGRERSSLGEWSPRGVFASAWSPALFLSPQADIAYYDAEVQDGRVVGAVSIEPVRDRLKLRAGRVDWGRTAFSPGATLEGLTARTLGASAESPTRLGTVRGRLDFFDVSDGNGIFDGEAQITPLWQPLPWRVRWHAGAYARNAEREDPRYWSPRPAYSVAFAALQRHWSSENTEVSASLRRGFALSRTAGDSWSGGVTGRVWLTRDLALGAEAWVVDAPRPGRYRVHHVGVSLQRLL
jgi:tetratricopeptide (TPR) repeat protein